MGDNKTLILDNEVFYEDPENSNEEDDEEDEEEEVEEDRNS